MNNIGTSYPFPNAEYLGSIDLKTPINATNLSGEEPSYLKGKNKPFEKFSLPKRPCLKPNFSVEKSSPISTVKLESYKKTRYSLYVGLGALFALSAYYLLASEGETSELTKKEPMLLAPRAKSLSMYREFIDIDAFKLLSLAPVFDAKKHLANLFENNQRAFSELNSRFHRELSIQRSWNEKSKALVLHANPSKIDPMKKSLDPWEGQIKRYFWIKPFTVEKETDLSSYDSLEEECLMKEMASYYVKLCAAKIASFGIKAIKSPFQLTYSLYHRLWKMDQAWKGAINAPRKCFLSWVDSGFEKIRKTSVSLEKRKNATLAFFHEHYETFSPGIKFTMSVVEKVALAPYRCWNSLNEFLDFLEESVAVRPPSLSEKLENTYVEIGNLIDNYRKIYEDNPTKKEELMAATKLLSLVIAKLLIDGGDLYVDGMSFAMKKSFYTALELPLICMDMPKHIVEKILKAPFEVSIDLLKIFLINPIRRKVFPPEKKPSYFDPILAWWNQSRRYVRSIAFHLTIQQVIDGINALDRLSNRAAKCLDDFSDQLICPSRELH